MKKVTKVESLIRLMALAVLSVAAFAGVMGLISGDIIIRGAIAGTLVFFTAKQLVMPN